MAQVRLLGAAAALAPDVNDMCITPMSHLSIALCFGAQNGGFGAQVHVLGAALALALDLGRVLLLEYDPEFTLFTEDAWCGESPWKATV